MNDQDVVDNIILIRQSLKYFINKYPNDPEIITHKIHLKRITKVLVDHGELTKEELT